MTISKISDEDIEECADTLFDAERFGFGESWSDANSVVKNQYRERAYAALLEQEYSE